MKKSKKKIKKSNNPEIAKKVSAKSDATEDKNKKTSEQAKKTRKNLQATVYQQFEELENRDELLKQGVVREEQAQEQILIRTKAMDSASDGIFIISSQKSGFPILYTNLSFQKLIGYAKNEIIGQDYFNLCGMKADSHVLNEIKSSMCQGKSFHGELLNFKKNGKKFWSSLRINPVYDNKGTITHFVGIQTDITVIKQKNLEIEEQREELLHVTRVGKLAEFVSSLAHEISQPLTAILSYAQAAQRLLLNREPELQEILQYIIDDDQRAAEVIKRLRLLLKKGKPTIETLNMNSLINDTVHLIQTHINVRQTVIQYNLENNLPDIQGDRIQLQQVILNLLSNSIEAMEENKDSRKILINAKSKDTDTILVEVIDFGSGIDLENMSKVFTHFFTSKTNGLGMGLPISRSIIEDHGGRLEAKNNADGGATFYFTIPVSPKNSHD